jgi:ankyrin repeat protein
MAKYSDTANWSQDRLDALLVYAADFGELDEAVELMQAGADPNGYALIMAIQAGHPRIVQAMLSFGADPNRRYVGLAPGRQATTPLNHAVACRELETIALLLDAGADPNAKDGEGLSSLERLRASSPAKASPDTDVTIRELLTSRGGR